MFFLSEIEHKLKLLPELLDRPLDKAIKGELDALFLDKVIENLGLCISVYDIRSIDGGFINGGASIYTVRFRLVMFRPFVGEILSARLKDSTKDGLRLSLGFFEDIYVPVPLLPSPNKSEDDPELKDVVRWSWKYEDGGEYYPIDGVDEIRFRVHNVSYYAVPLEQANDSNEKDSEQKDSDKKDSKPFAPMVVTGSLYGGDGLGPISWWV